MPDVTRKRSPGLLLPFFIAVFALTLPARGQEPTPTPTPTPTPRPVPAGTELYSFTGALAYDGANMVKEANGSVWAVSAEENAISRMSGDRTKLSRWIMAKDAAPSSLLRDDDGTFWITELGGFKVAHFDPATGSVTEYTDGARRPTALVKRPDGKFWLPETGGLLAVFDPAVPNFIYYTTPGVYYNSYPWQDPDGSIFSLDFIFQSVVHWAPDVSTARIWTLPSTTLSPSKIVRLADGKLWITFYASGQLGRFDDATGTLDVFTLPSGSFPYDIHNYKGLVVYSDQAGQVGFLDPGKSTPSSTSTLTFTDAVPVARTTFATTAVTSALTLDEQDLTPPSVVVDVGSGQPGLAQILVNSGSSLWAMLIDEARGRIFFGTSGAFGALSPPPKVDDKELYLTSASAAPFSSDSARSYRTQIVTWNRGTPDSTGVTKVMNYVQRILPDGWIAGLSGAATQPVPAGTLVSQQDVIGAGMDSAGVQGGVRITSDVLDDTFAWSRVSLSAPSGGTLGDAANAVAGTAALGAGDTGFLFASSDVGEQTIAGVLVTEASRGTISIVDASGVSRASYAYDWPSGYHVQGTSIFDAFALPTLPSARIVCTVATGRVLLFGSAVDRGSGDVAGLAPVGASALANSLQIAGFTRGGGVKPTLQIFNSGTGSANVGVSFRVAQPVDGPALAPGGPLATTTVPPGAVVTLDLGSPAAAATGTLDVAADQPVAAFATFRAALSSGGNVVFTSRAAFAASPSAIPSGSRGVFLSATQNDDFSSTLHLTSTSANPGDVTVKFTGADGTAVGSRTVTVPPSGAVSLPGWLAGAKTDLGRLDVVPADGTGPFLAVLVRQDLRSRDTDVIQPLVIPK